MAKKEDLAEDMTFDYYAGDDFPTQNGTVVNNFEEEQSKKTLAVADVADKIANRNNDEDNASQKKVIILGILSGFAMFALVVVIDVFMNV